jgi:hypothetical protein
MPSEKNPENSPARKRAPRKSVAAPASDVALPNFVDPQHRGSLIARAAYFRAMERGFAPGNELEDWLAAEAEVDAGLLRGAAGTAQT